MSTDMALDEIEYQKIKELEDKTTTVQGPLGLIEKLNELVASKEGEESDYYLKYVLNQQRSLIGVNFKDPISIWYHDYELRPAPSKLKDMIHTFLIEHGSSKDQFKDLYFQRERQVKLTASINGETLPLPSDPNLYAYESISHAMREKPSYLAKPQVSKIGMFSRGTKLEPSQNTFENDLPKPPTKKSMKRSG